MESHKKILTKTQDFVRSKLGGDGSAHDWWHIFRVVQNAKAIAAKEGGDLFIIELAALLHDIGDWKFHDGDSTVGPKIASDWLSKLNVDQGTIQQVADIVEHISYKGGTNKYQMQSLEGKIVQDADRLDALGAIGVARTFTYGGSINREMYNPDIKPKQYKSFESFQKAMAGNPTINHFYEKLLLLKDKMNTPTAKSMAKTRHEFMEQYLERFYAEWAGNQ